MRILAMTCVLCSLGIAVVGAAGQCVCTGQSVAKRYEGGDNNPLHWYSLERRITAGTATSSAVYCYERSVANRSDRDVTDVFWKVAGFDRPLIPKATPICDATTLLGNLKVPHPSGALNYSVGPQSYSTTVYAPSGGWSTPMTEVKTSEWPMLESTMRIFIKDSGMVTLNLRSSVTDDSAGHTFRYEISNMGAMRVGVFWNVPLTQEFGSLEFNPNSPTPVDAESKVVRQARSKDPVGWTATNVEVYSIDKVWLGSSVASAYSSVKGVRKAASGRGQ